MLIWHENLERILNNRSDMCRLTTSEAHKEWSEREAPNSSSTGNQSELLNSRNLL